MYFKLRMLKSKCHLGYHLELILCVRIGLILGQSLVRAQYWFKHSSTISLHLVFIKGFAMGPSGNRHGWIIKSNKQPSLIDRFASY